MASTISPAEVQSKFSQAQSLIIEWKTEAAALIGLVDQTIEPSEILGKAYEELDEAKSEIAVSAEDEIYELIDTLVFLTAYGYVNGHEILSVGVLSALQQNISEDVSAQYQTLDEILQKEKIAADEISTVWGVIFARVIALGQFDTFVEAVQAVIAKNVANRPVALYGLENVKKLQNEGVSDQDMATKIMPAYERTLRLLRDIYGGKLPTEIASIYVSLIEQVAFDPLLEQDLRNQITSEALLVYALINQLEVSEEDLPDNVRDIYMAGLNPDQGALHVA